MKYTLVAFLIFCFFSVNSQDKHQQKKYSSLVDKLILERKLDSASYYLDSVSNQVFKKNALKLIRGEEVSYKVLYHFISRLSNKQSIQYEKVSKYINNNVKEPKSNQINLNYAEIKWTQVSKLRDEVGLDEASKVQKKLEDYINKFDDNDVEVLKVKTKIRTHPIVMYQIQQDVKNGKKLVLESLEIAKKLNDKELQIIFLYHLSDYLLIERKLQEYIDVSEESLRLEEELPRESPYYFSTIQHLIDAYTFKGGHTDRVLFLINKLYNNEETRIHSYSLYAKIVSGLDENSQLKKEIFKKFGVNTILELVTKFEKLGKDLNSNDFFHLINESSRALYAHNQGKLAMRYKDRAIELTRNIYSKDLASTLANFKTEQAVKEKELQIEYEKERTALYGVISVLAIVLLIISLLVLRKIKKQSKQLSNKNKAIEEALKEKELLIKEVHHRVKNNFQIVSSLLELQTKGIEDERALELASEGKNRVKSMALIHQKLYQEESGLIDFDEYIKLLVKELSAIYSSGNQINTSIASKDMKFDVDTAIPLGLIVNEIITNSYKYAFTNKKGNNNLFISINKEDSENYKLVIEDNGPGLAKNVNIKKAKSLGLRLVNRLVKQLHGTLKQTNDNGARFEIYFKDSNTRQLVN